MALSFRFVDGERPTRQFPAMPLLRQQSRSSFQDHSRRVTAMGPLQYQKLLRLYKARPLMTDAVDSATARQRGASTPYGLGMHSSIERARSGVWPDPAC